MDFHKVFSSILQVNGSQSVSGRSHGQICSYGSPSS